MERGIYQVGKFLGVQKNYYIEYETGEYYIVKIAVPGEAEVENITVVMSNNTLKIRYPGNIFTEEFYYYYRVPGSFIKDETFAELEDGVLSVKIRKNLHN